MFEAATLAARGATRARTGRRSCLAPLGLLVSLVSAGCVGSVDEQPVLVAGPAHTSPLAPPAIGRWAPLHAESTVCAWRGGVFSPADFDAVPPPRKDTCISLASCEWRIEFADDESKIFIDGSVDRSVPTTRSLPFELPPWTGPATRGRATIHPVEDGWLIGFDAGEWGGSLWWYSGDGAQRRRLSANPVVGLFEHGDAVWALGESAQSPRRGQVLVLEKDEGEAWQPHLGPQVLRGVAAAARDGETLLVASLHAVEEIDAAGQVQLLAEVDWLDGFREPTSIARMSSGVILVGMKHGLARLTPSREGGYVEDFLVPPPCRVWGFIPGHATCACAGLEPEGFSFDPDVIHQPDPSSTNHESPKIP